MRILLTGAGGLVGSEFRRLDMLLSEVVATSRRDLDLRDEETVRSTLRTVRPDVIVNAAAFMSSDKAEGEWENCFAVNAAGPTVLAEEALRLGALLIHYSCDEVFSAPSDAPFSEGDPVSPETIFGASKVAGEKGIAATGAQALILRTSCIYGLHRKNLLLDIVEQGRAKPELRLPDNHILVPTSAKAMARLTERLILEYASRPRGSFPAGIYHATASGSTTLREFAAAILRDVPARETPDGQRAVVLPMEPPPPPVRSSLLSNQKLFSTFGMRLPSWQDQLRETLNELPEALKQIAARQAAAHRAAS